MGSHTFKLSELTSKRILSVTALEEHKIIAKISTRDFDNIEDLLKFINIDPKSAVLAEQVHGNNVEIANEKHKGAGITKPAIKTCDALITQNPNIPLIIRTADCIPLFILEPNKRVIGLLHIGWKGSILKIAEKAVNKMINNFKISPPNCIIAAGPSISKSCYEIDGQVVTRLKQEFKDYQKYIIQKDKDHWYFDLLGINIQQLKNIGIKEENIYLSGYCTHCRTDLFYSYRKERKNTGRIFSVIMLKK